MKRKIWVSRLGKHLVFKRDEMLLSISAKEDVNNDFDTPIWVTDKEPKEDTKNYHTTKKR